MPQFHDVLTSPGGWTCSCTASGRGGPREADDHALDAYAAERGLVPVDPLLDAPPDSADCPS